MIYPVVLTGGSGTRLWPVSRKSYPKQFRSFAGENTLFQDTLKRMSGGIFANPVVLTGEDFRFIVRDQMDAMKITPHQVFVEPEGKNTAPAVLAAALALREQGGETLMLVAPADHDIPDHAGFAQMVETALPAAREGKIVTFGVTPDRAETGYGYLELPAQSNGTGPHELMKFVEKPDQAAAQDMLNAGHYLWNSGLFLFRVDTILNAFETHAADMIAPVTQAVENAKGDLDFHRLDATPWAQVTDISLDYAVMEKSNALSVVRFNGRWNDLGSWDAVWRDLPQDADHNATAGDAHGIDCFGTLLSSDTDGPAVVGIGLTDMITVATKDAVLVAPKDRAQDVKTAVTRLRENGRKQADETPRAHRPWGWYETLALGGRFQVKRIVVTPGGVLSLQSHHHRSEHWIVVQGTAKVTIGEDEKLVSENQSVYIPLGEVHRMENPGKLPMVLIEVQTGAYLGEDDIVRYEDQYNRA